MSHRQQAHSARPFVRHLEIDVCNNHQHDGEYHYHAKRDFLFFMVCYKAIPQASNFAQKFRGSAASSASCLSGGRGQKLGKKILDKVGLKIGQISAKLFQCWVFLRAILKKLLVRPLEIFYEWQNN